MVRDKERQNRDKHAVAFADTFAVFEDPHALTIEDAEHNEQRFVTIGMDGFGRVLVVAYTFGVAKTSASSQPAEPPIRR